MRLRLLLSLALVFFAILAEGQNSLPRTVAEKKVQIPAASATVRDWLQEAERQSGITISYNPSLVEDRRIVRFDQACRLTLPAFIDRLLQGRDYRLVPLEEGKLVLQVEPTVFFQLTGTVSKAGSGEKLCGATVRITEKGGERSLVMTDANGVFHRKVRAGSCRLEVSHVGYGSVRTKIEVDADRRYAVALSPLEFNLKQAVVKPRNSAEELDEGSPSNRLSLSNTDFFAQLRILPGVTVGATGGEFQVDGGGIDENLFLLDGAPVYHPGHISSALPSFNGDALRSVAFHKSFIPAQFEGRLSSVTDVQLKAGDKLQHRQTLTLDMPAASAVLEGPIVKNKLSYMVGARRSWLDFFDHLLREDDRLNHSFHDVNFKFSYDLSPASTLELSGYHASDDYHLPDLDGKQRSLLRWTNNVYALRYHTLLGKRMTHTAFVSFSRHTNRATAPEFGFDSLKYVRSGIRTLMIGTEFTYTPDNVYTARWGLKWESENYRLVSLSNTLTRRRAPISQGSFFYDNRLHLSPRLFVQVGVNFMGYFPGGDGQKHYFGIQPRFQLKYSAGERNLVFVSFSQMQQYYHYLRLYSLALPFDFRMPSIDGYRPTFAQHYETGWKHFLKGGQIEVSVYYKRRHHLVAFRPMDPANMELWRRDIMVGDGDSYGLKGYLYNRWRHFDVQLAYTWSNSREWFSDLPSRGKLPSLYDLPHSLTGALSYRLGRRSTLTVGGMLRSGRIIDWVGYGSLEDNIALFRSERESTKFRFDASYSLHTSFRRCALFLRAGLFNIVGNPAEDDVLDFYSINLHSHCLPFASITVKF